VQHKDLHFTLNEELNNQITYLDLNLINKQWKIEMEVYRKPTSTDVTINKKSCHPKKRNYQHIEVGYTDSRLYHLAKQINKGN
jgi:hypothetical protein